MGYKIVWLPKAEENFAEIIEWLQLNWTDKEMSKFIKRTNKVLELISTNPEIYRKSEKANIHQAIITKHNLLLYKINGSQVELLTFFDTKQDPDKKFE